jgi:hypothetical protein
LVVVLGFVALAAAALELSAYGVARFLNSDFLTPYFFCRELLSGPYPLSGWTLSASPYFVPDHAILCALLATPADSALAYILYTVVFYLGLFTFAGLCVKTILGRAEPAFLAVLLLANVFLSLRLLPGHAHLLWWLGAPGFHGGGLLLGFCYLWVLGSRIRGGGTPGRAPAALFLVGFLAMVSDSLFLLQILLPASVALWVGRRRHPAFGRCLRWQAVSGVAAVLCALLFKPICQANDWFYFTRVFRNAPTPSNQWRSLETFLSDAPLLLRGGWGFLILLLFAAGGLWILLRHSRMQTAEHGPVVDPACGVSLEALHFFRLFCVASLLIMLPIPILTGGWKYWSNVRYLFNWLVLPGFLLAFELAAFTSNRWSLTSGGPWRRRSLVVLAFGFLVCLGVATVELRKESLRFPYPPDVAALDDLIRRRGMTRGLAGYWTAKYFTALSNVGLELRQIYANGDPRFWDNNAFGYFARKASDGESFWPSYEFILTDGLNENDITRVFGEPEAKEKAGRHWVWIYSVTGQARIRSALEPAIRAKLGPKRLSRIGLTDQISPSADETAR